LTTDKVAGIFRALKLQGSASPPVSLLFRQLAQVAL
jgi:hypothetical protein